MFCFRSNEVSEKNNVTIAILNQVQQTTEIWWETADPLIQQFWILSILLTNPKLTEPRCKSLMSVAILNLSFLEEYRYQTDNLNSNVAFSITGPFLLPRIANYKRAKYKKMKTYAFWNNHFILLVNLNRLLLYFKFYADFLFSVFLCSARHWSSVELGCI